MVTPLPTMNPLSAISGFIDPRRQMLLGLASGLVSGNNWSEGLGRGFAMAAEGKKADDAWATAQKAEAERARQLNYTIQAFQKAGRQDLVDMANAGLMGEAWKQFTTSAAPADPIKMNPGDTLLDPKTYQPLYTAPTETKQPNAPSGYQWGDSGQLTYIPGGPADPANKRGGVPSPTIAKEIFDADSSLQAGMGVVQSLTKALELNKTAWDGPGADVRSSGAALFGNQEAVQTQELKNIVTANALESLKAIFGGMPTEGERKILLEVQGSVDQPRAVREAIFRRALAAVERRNAYNKSRADALRSNDYFDPGFSPVAGQNGDGTDVDSILKGYGL